jgi:hypothetical protein
MQFIQHDDFFIYKRRFIYTINGDLFTLVYSDHKKD